MIIDAHLLNEAASNCLLKTLEEPSNGIFILLTSKLNLLLDTIISRCQIIRFRSFSSKQINSILKKYLDNSKININTKLKLGDLINSEKKIILILDAHLLNEPASNCLLKTLEEPSNGIFILLTSKLNLLLDTIISRCQIV